MRITSASECARTRAAATPPKPAPTITTRLRAPDPSAARGKAAPSEGREASEGRVPTSCSALLIVLPLPGLARARRKLRASALEPPSSRRGGALDLPAQLDEPEQHLVPFRR